LVNESGVSATTLERAADDELDAGRLAKAIAAALHRAQTSI
jgi:Na+-transporting methylmalonyl-CoA/oxaloacetate decarboxylase gamma subunit